MIVSDKQILPSASCKFFPSASYKFYRREIPKAASMKKFSREDNTKVKEVLENFTPTRLGGEF